MALAQPGDGLSHEHRLLLEFWNGPTSTVAHSRLDPADQLVHHSGEWTFVGDASFDAFRDEFRLRSTGLEVSILAAPFHGTDRSHSTIDLVRAGLVEDGFARGFICPCKEAADHDGG